jgi:hypothetical protein
VGFLFSAKQFRAGFVEFFEAEKSRAIKFRRKGKYAGKEDSHDHLDEVARHTPGNR